jgi:hypothetical protein
MIRVVLRFQIVISIFFVSLMNPVHAQTFVHPGLLHSKEDLKRMKTGVIDKTEPIYSGYLLFIQNPASRFTYKMQGPMAMVGRNPTVGQGIYDSDANAAHQNAIMWAITGDKQYADKAIEIVNAWSSTLQSITGKDAVLMAGLGPFKMINAAEILRYTGAGWSDADIKKTEKHFKEVIYPVIKDFAPFANGNWDAAAIKTMMAIAVFCNDRPMFERALHYYVSGQGNGRLTYYVINEEGQIQESGRDQAHTQLGIGLLAECCAIAWNQGLNLYAYEDNRLLKGFEYVAKFNLGNEVSFTEWLDRTGKYHHTKISQQSRGDLRAVYEQVYNHYVKQMGLSAPFTQQAAEKLRPEGPGRPGADHPGYGTLYFSRPKTVISVSGKPAAPGGIVAVSSEKEINLTWIESIGASSYIVKRATQSKGPFAVIAKNIKLPKYIDKQVKPGTLYYYIIIASNPKGESGNSYITPVAAGLVSPWKQQDLGGVSLKGTTSFDGKIFAVESTGFGIDSVSDGAHFTYQSLRDDGEITVRFVPQPSSQFSKFGLTFRESTEGKSAHVSLSIYPGNSGQMEAPDWHTRFVVRRLAGEKAEITYVGPGLSEPAVSNGRLTGYFWLRLQRKGNVFSGFTSYDGKTWTNAGDVSVPLAKDILIGFIVASGMKNSTTVFFDHVSIGQATQSKEKNNTK